MSTSEQFQLRQRQWAEFNRWEVEQAPLAMLQEDAAKWNPRYVDGPMPTWLKATVILGFLSVIPVLFRLLKTWRKRHSK